MATIDIREGSSAIDTITFADNHDGVSSIRRVNGFSKSEWLELLDEFGECNVIRMSDIDNLILALKKAKELWGN